MPDGGCVNVDAVVEELYLLPPAEFIKARDALVAEARKEGEKDTAKTIAALRRPTAAAFASNLLVRRRPEGVRALLDLGEALRGALRPADHCADPAGRLPCGLGYRRSYSISYACHTV